MLLPAHPYRLHGPCKAFWGYYFIPMLIEHFQIRMWECLVACICVRLIISLPFQFHNRNELSSPGARAASVQHQGSTSQESPRSYHPSRPCRGARSRPYLCWPNGCSWYIVGFRGSYIVFIIWTYYGAALTWVDVLWQCHAQAGMCDFSSQVFICGTFGRMWGREFCVISYLKLVEYCPSNSTKEYLQYLSLCRAFLHLIICITCDHPLTYRRDDFVNRILYSC